MDKEKAIEIMRQISQVVKGTLQEHKLINSAIEYLSTLTEPKKASSDKHSDGQEAK